MNQKEIFIRRVPAPVFKVESVFYTPLRNAANKLKALSNASAVIESSKQLGLGPWTYIVKSRKLGILSTNYSQYEKLALYARMETGLNVESQKVYSFLFGKRRLIEEIRDYGSFFIRYTAGYCLISTEEYSEYQEGELKLSNVFELTDKNVGYFIYNIINGNGSVAVCDDVELSQKVASILDSHGLVRMPLRFFLTTKNTVR
ncbi:hypothetical protein [Kosmotoga pacifica]|uniref:hypothetical protein n=1 Tax=Kosmotoga pacifica TaxID=1330330 RepID=UPI0014707997|nr:hypothetical protein [Kosmotoga pacifica]